MPGGFPRSVGENEVGKACVVVRPLGRAPKRRHMM